MNIIKLNIYLFKKIVLLLFLSAVMLIIPVYSEYKNAIVFAATGDVKVIPANSNIGSQCVKGMVVHPLDWVKTGPGGSVTLAFDDKAENVIKINENSLVILKLDGYFKIQLLKGQVYAILENVEHGETFRALTPSVVTESASSGWVVNSEGTSSTVVVVNGEAFVCGINKDGSVRKNRYEIKEGFGRTANVNEDPGAAVQAPDNVVNWFKQQVVQHHLDQVIADKVKKEEPQAPKPEALLEQPKKPEAPAPQTTKTVQRSAQSASTKGKNVAIIDGQEVDILEYLYKGRLSEPAEKDADESNPSGAK